jgi:hypothetical protein
MLLFPVIAALMNEPIYNGIKTGRQVFCGKILVMIALVQQRVFSV